MAKDLVLVVDDDQAVRTMLGKVMAGNDFDVVETASGEEALAAVEENDFDLILLDINMHGMDGFEVIHELRGRGENVPIMVVSGRKADYDTLYGLDIGADEYITKPFNPVTQKPQLSIRGQSDNRGRAFQIRHSHSSFLQR